MDGHPSRRHFGNMFRGTRNVFVDFDYRLRGTFNRNNKTFNFRCIMATGSMGQKNNIVALWWASVKLTSKNSIVLKFDQMHITLSPYWFLKTIDFNKQGDIMFIIVDILMRWSQTGLWVSALQVHLVVIFKIRWLKPFVGSVLYPIACMFWRNAT